MHCGKPTPVTPPLPPDPVTDPLRDQLIAATRGEYEVLHELGRGGMAAVYLALDLALHRHVAIKVMIPGLESTAGMADRFLLEARTSAQLSHANIIPIYAVRTTGDLRYFVMKFVAGRSLDQVLAAEGPLGPDLVRSILAQVGAALEHAHSRGVVHRDIKPANIMLDEDGSAIVADFGIAKVTQAGSLTRTGSTIGTPAYMSPEQCTGQPVTGATDQYALGCVAFELLTGRPPFVHEEAVPVLLAHVSDPPPPLIPLCHDCPYPLAAAIERMLAKLPGDRWPTIAELIESTEAAQPLGDPAVRSRLKQLAAPRELPVIPRLPSMPVSPLPRPSISTSPAAAAPTTSGELKIRLAPGAARITTGESVRVDGVLIDPRGTPVAGAPLTWRSQAPEIASVSDGGVITGLSEGQGSVIVTSQGISAELPVVVARVPVAKVVLTPPPSAWAPGERRVLQAAALDLSGAVLPGRSMRWTSHDASVAVVDQLGVVLGVSPGLARIQAESEGQVADVAVEIRPAQGVLAILPAAGALAAGQVVLLQAIWKTSTGSHDDAAGVTWVSSDPTVLRVSEEGELNALRPGTARVRATLGDQQAEVQYQVTRVDVATVRILPRISALSVGEEVRLETHALDRLGTNLPGRVVTWHSSDSKVVAISADGLIRGTGVGTARISAAIGAGLASLDLRVSPATVSGIRIDPATVSLKVGDVVLLKAAVQGGKGITLPGVGVEWLSSDPQVASVSPDGVVRGVRFGTARIAASAGGKRATVAVEVRAATTMTTVSSPRLRTGGEKP